MNDDSQDSPVEQNAGRRASRATSTQSTKSQIRNDEARVQPTYVGTTELDSEFCENLLTLAR